MGKLDLWLLHSGHLNEINVLRDTLYISNAQKCERSQKYTPVFCLSSKIQFILIRILCAMKFKSKNYFLAARYIFFSFFRSVTMTFCMTYAGKGVPAKLSKCFALYFHLAICIYIHKAFMSPCGSIVRQ